MPLSPTTQFHAARINPALQDRTIGHQFLSEQSRWFALFLESGQAIAQTQNGEYDLSGTAVLWGALSENTRLKIGAGSVGSYLFFNDRILSDAIGLVVEAAELRLFAQQPVMLSIDRTDIRGQQLGFMFEQITAEVHNGQFGSEITISAYVRLLLVLLWRNVDKDVADYKVIGDHKAKLNQFRNLVEAHFRARWKARKYADALGLTYDRLHDICTRALDKPPALLIRERCFHEAQILLQRTSHSADHISEMLGFSSASQFNHFYKSMSGESPGSFRRSTLKSSHELPQEITPRFSDWP